MTTFIETLAQAADMVANPAAYQASPETAGDLAKISNFLLALAAHRPGYDEYVEDFDYSEELDKIVRQVRSVVSYGLPALSVGAQARIAAGREAFCQPAPGEVVAGLSEAMGGPLATEAEIARMQDSLTYAGQDGQRGPIINAMRLPADDLLGFGEPDPQVILNQNLRALHFKAEKCNPEGAEWLVRSFDGWRIIVSDEEGNGMPEPDCWAVGLYSAESDSEPRLYYTSAVANDPPIEDALAAVLDHARNFKAELSQREHPVEPSVVFDKDAVERHMVGWKERIGHPMEQSRRAAIGHRAKAREALPKARRALDDLRQRLGAVSPTDLTDDFVVQMVLDVLHVVDVHQKALDAEFHTY